ncbi:MAG TPA: hypothetical protein VFP12_15480 [Allosphingosinicella sp.]|nr:hypothetical protein [Allosphingosinicella sp.]
MKLPHIVALLFLAAPGAALATSGLTCRPASGAGPTLDLVIGHGAGPAIAGARLDGRPAPVAQSWVDSRYLWLDLTDPNATRYEAKLRAVFRPRLRGRPALGTLARGGRVYKMRCVEA